MNIVRSINNKKYRAVRAEKQGEDVAVYYRLVYFTGEVRKMLGIPYHVLLAAIRNLNIKRAGRDYLLTQDDIKKIKKVIGGDKHEITN